MRDIRTLKSFFHHAAFDRKLLPSHISLYSAILSMEKDCDEDSFVIYRKELMRRSKLSSTATYHKCIKDLVALGYICYSPSYHPHKKTIVRLIFKTK